MSWRRNDETRHCKAVTRTHLPGRGVKIERTLFDIVNRNSPRAFARASVAWGTRIYWITRTIGVIDRSLAAVWMAISCASSPNTRFVVAASSGTQ
jgi:hypothetical protein